MTGRVLEMVTLFLRESLEEDSSGDLRHDLVESLMEQGHNPNEISAALSIVDKIHERLECPWPGPRGPVGEHFFMKLEEHHISPEVRGYLNQLVGMQVLDRLQREELVERILVLDAEDLTVEETEMLVEELLQGRPKMPGEFDETISDFFH
ncbi:MAG: Protein Smg [bacterium]|nr:Protein Smg [bacterium]